MALSNRYTVKEFWREAILDVDEPAWGNIASFQKFEMINRVQEICQAQFADIINEAYMTSVDVLDKAIDGTEDYAVLSGNTIDISALNILRYSNQVKFLLESSLTQSIQYFTKLALGVWMESAFQNSNSIACAVSGNIIYLKKGSTLQNYGALKLHYPRVTVRVGEETDYIDLLDGAMVQIGIMVLRQRILKRLPHPPETDASDIHSAIQALYNSFGNNISKEALKQKVEALV